MADEAVRDVAAAAADQAAAAVGEALRHPAPTVAQLGLFIMWMVGLSFWAMAEFATYRRR